MTTGKRHRRAFSLVELLTVVAILAIVAAMAAPRYANSLALYRSQAAAQRIAADLNLARSQAKITSLGQSVVFSVVGNSYILPGMPGPSGQPSPYGLVLSSDPYQATLVGAAFASASTITYDRFGQPSTGGTVSIQSGSSIKNVVVNAITGVASVQ